MKASLERCTLIVNLNNYSNKVPIPHLVYFSTFMFIKKNFQSFENHSVPYRKVLSQSNDRAMLEIKAFQEVSARRLSFAKARVTSQKLAGPKSARESLGFS